MGFKTCMGATAMAAGLFVSTGSAAIISQAPNQANAFASNANFVASLADDFIVGAGGANLGVLTWYGMYGQNVAVDDWFTIRIHSDAAGLPDGGAGVLNLSGVTADTRTDTGTDFFGIDEYQYTYDLGGLNLGAGTYWIEIFNETALDESNWGWETGALDAVNGRFDAVRASQNPGVIWNHVGADMAFSIEAVPAPGALVLLGLAGCVGVRRRRS